MSLYIRIYCDECNMSKHVTIKASVDSVNQALALLEQWGWETGKTTYKQLCPACNEKRKGDEP